VRQSSSQVSPGSTCPLPHTALAPAPFVPALVSVAALPLIPAFACVPPSPEGLFDGDADASASSLGSLVFSSVQASRHDAAISQTSQPQGTAARSPMLRQDANPRA
jgi:hypothetical protein